MVIQVPLFSIALRRADEISNALFARGYNYTGRVSTGSVRSDYVRSQYHKTTLDWVGCIVLVTLFVAVGVAEIGFGVFSIQHSPLNIYLRGILHIPF